MAKMDKNQLHGAIEAAIIDLQLLLAAVEADDPKAEIRIRVIDTIKRLDGAR